MFILLNRQTDVPSPVYIAKISHAAHVKFCLTENVFRVSCVRHSTHLHKNMKNGKDDSSSLAHQEEEEDIIIYSQIPS